MAKRPIELLRVEDKRRLTPNMLRVTLGARSLSGYSRDDEGGYVKLLLPKDDPSQDVSGLDPTAVDPAAYVKRSFTIRSFDPDDKTLVLDFVAQGHPGPASDWVERVEPGAQVLITGPGPVKSLDASADWVLLAADMAALPALSVQLERLPAGARGAAVIEVLSEADRQPLRAPAGVELHWVTSGPVQGERLVEAVRARPWGDGRVSTWSACEFTAMKRLRSYFFDERGVSRDDSYISSYWKIDASDEQHKLAKRDDVVA